MGIRGNENRGCDSRKVNIMKRYNIILRIIFPILAILCLVFIFGNSLNKGNMVKDNVSKVTTQVEKVIVKASKNVTKGSVESSALSKFAVKSGHIGEFLLFAAFLTLSYKFNFGKIKPFAFQILFIGLISSNLDEYIQSFSDGRTSCISDVFFDFAGILAGFLLTCAICAIIKKGAVKIAQSEESERK